MLLAAIEPGKEMAVANFLLAIFLMFTFAIPLLLITRGDKTEANLQLLVATVNPWYEVVKPESAQVVITEITTSVKTEPNLELTSEHKPLLAIEDNIFEIKSSESSGESSSLSLQTDDELLAA